MAAALEGVAVDHLLSMFVSPTEARDATTSSACPQGPALVAAPQQRHIGSHTPTQVTVGYSITPINLSDGQSLAEPQILSGTAALALHGLLMKLHAESMQEQLTAKPEVCSDTAAHHSVSVSAAANPDLNDAASAPLATPAAATDQPSIDDLPPDVLRLLPKELLEQGPAALLEQLQQYVQLKQQLVGHKHATIQPGQQESHRRTTRVQVVHSDPLHALAAACEEQDGLLKYKQHCERSGSDGSGTSCTDPLEVSPEHLNHRTVGRRQGELSNDLPWSEQAAAVAESEGEQQQLPSQHDMAMYIKKQLQNQSNSKERSHMARLSEAVSTVNVPSSVRAAAVPTGTGGAEWAAPPSLKRKRAPGAPQYRGVRLRPWGTFGAEVRDPGSGTRVWLGSFNTAEEAALTYDAAVRLLRGQRGVTNLPEPPEPERSKYITNAQVLLSKAHAKQPGGQPQQGQQFLEGPELQQQDDDFMQQASDTAGTAFMTKEQQHLRQLYQQSSFWQHQQQQQQQEQQQEQQQQQRQQQQQEQRQQQQQQQQQVLDDTDDQLLQEPQVGDLDDQRQHLRQQYQQPAFWSRSEQPAQNSKNKLTTKEAPGHVTQQRSPVDDPGFEQRHEQTGWRYIAGAGSSSPASPGIARLAAKPDSTYVADLGAYGQQAQQYEEELRHLQSVLQLGQAGVAGAGCSAGEDADSHDASPTVILPQAPLDIKVEP